MRRRRDWIIGIALFAITMFLYWPAVRFPFVNYDDPAYVYKNPAVTNGLSWNCARWAATAVVEANWHPLTLLSHMADCSVFGLFAGGHHLTNILLHSANAVLLLLLLRRMTGLFWPSALAAALFAWHPLNTESVAWIAERKNVLSTFFFILTLWAYLRYAENPRPGRYALTLILFALGLMAKPMLVTLPFLMLLLDYWPLRRIASAPGFLGGNRQTHRLVFLEKIPFLVLSAADCVITCVAQNSAGSIKSFAALPMESRLLNIPVAYATYLEKMLWPAKLCVFYAFPEKLSVGAALISLILLAAGTAAAWHWRFQFRWLPVGWFWFLGALVPVIGLVQTGNQAMADRHAYVPLIGIFLILACGLHQFLAVKPKFRVAAVALAAAFLCVCLALTREQLMCWRNSVALFTQAVSVNPQSAKCHDLLGAALRGDGRLSEAVGQYAEAVRFRPDDADLQYHLGLGLVDTGRFAESESHLTAAIRKMPDNSIFHNTLGVALMQDGKPQEAEKEFSRAIELEPDYSKPYFNFGKTLLATGQTAPAITNFIAALRLEPDWPEALENLADAYARAGNLPDAVSTAAIALKQAQNHHLDSLAQRIAGKLKTYQSLSTKQLKDHAQSRN